MRVWYVPYGSNLSLARFRCYLAGGRPDGGARLYDGCRDTAEPEAVRPVELRGRIYFAGRSRVWGGGMAFYDPDANGTVAARAYLLTAGQLSDVIAQESWRAVGTDLDLAGLGPGEWLPVETAHYRRVLHTGTLDGAAMFTLTSATHAEEDWAAPAAAYLRTIGTGLREAHGWGAERAGRYLAAAPGARGMWTGEQVAAELSPPGQAPPAAR
jgi:hypothetical protein